MIIFLIEIFIIHFPNFHDLNHVFIILTVFQRLQYDIQDMSYCCFAPMLKDTPYGNNALSRILVV